MQSETILSREKQVKDLRMENEQLRQRLERMERRVRGESDPASPVPPLTKPHVESQRDPRSRKRPGVSLEGQPNKRLKKSEEKRAETPFTPIPENKIKVEEPVPEAAPFDELTDEICQEIDDKFRLREEVADVKEETANDPNNIGTEKNSLYQTEANKSKIRKNQRKSVSISISSNGKEYSLFILLSNIIR